MTILERLNKIEDTIGELSEKKTLAQRCSIEDRLAFLEEDVERLNLLDRRISALETSLG